MTNIFSKKCFIDKLAIFIFIAYGALSLIISPQYIADIMQISKFTTWCPDSYGYASCSPTRSLGYPIVLNIVKYISGAFENIFILHIIVHMLACYMLWSTLRKYKPSLLFDLSCLVILFNPASYLLQHTILTDSFFYSFILLIVSELIRSFYEQHYKWWKLAAYIGLSIVIRPAGWAFLPIIVVLFLYKNKTSFIKQQFKVALLVSISIIAVERISHVVYHGYNSASLATVTLFGKAAMIATDSKNDLLPKNHLLYNTAKLLQKDTDQFKVIADNIPLSCTNVIFSDLEVFFQYGYRPNFISEGVLENLSKEIIKYNMHKMPKFVACHLIQSIFVYPRKVFFNIGEHLSLIKKIDDTVYNKSYRDNIVKSNFVEPSNVMHIIIKFSTLGLFLVSIIVMLYKFISLFKKGIPMDKRLDLASLLAFLSNGYILFVSIFNIGLVRYTAAIFPVLIIIALLVCDVVISKIKGFKS